MASATQMYCYEDRRLASFNRKREKARPAWPHPDTFSVTPASLAAAGFIFSPVPDADDSARCFLCEKQLGGWEEGDEALQQHLEHTNNSCPFARMRAIQQARQDDDVWYEDRQNRWMLDMHSQEAVTLRKRTFDVPGFKWPHDRKKGWLPTSANLAAAGFTVRFITEDDGDSALCAYCGICLSGWEKSDDPIEEHRRRHNERPCPFFTFAPAGHPASEPGSEAAVQKTASSMSSKTKKRASKKTPAPVSRSTVAGSDVEMEGPPSRTGRKTRGTRSTVPSEEDEPAQPATLRASRRGAAKVDPVVDTHAARVEKSIPIQQAPDAAAETAPPHKLKKSTRKPRGGKKSTKAIVLIQPDADETPEIVAVPATEADPSTKFASTLQHASTSLLDQARPRDSPSIDAAHLPERRFPLSKDPRNDNLPSEIDLIQMDIDVPVTHPDKNAMSADLASLNQTRDTSGLTERERLMTVMEWYEHLSDQACQRVETEMQRKLVEFDRKAAEARRMIVDTFEY